MTDDLPTAADRDWYDRMLAEESETGVREFYRILPDDGRWQAVWLLDGAGSHRTYPLGLYDTPQAALDSCRTDARRRAADDEINAIEADRAKVPLDDQSAPERD